jgi:hypothetical protein
MARIILVEQKSRRHGRKSKITQRAFQHDLPGSLTKRLQILRANMAGSPVTSIDTRDAEKVRKVLGELATLL